uniref:Uncharacterized protein n=1 Tax=Hanusia phi TaxID=3032 RepID=A0A6T7NLP8_9CRYP|mmetsp:Transcript_18107/g.41078  ORF Transcript_18107/g.41078 Transcript_18107/m.41078 type:complete len:114 (+) Transcript_18107:168-509(+)|eukprot:447703-Hanusia_phi.AAC.1
MAPETTRTKAVRLTLNDKQKAYLEQIKQTSDAKASQDNKGAEPRKLDFVCYVSDGSELLANVTMAKRKYDLKSRSAVDLRQLQRQADVAEMVASLRRSASMKRLAAPERLEWD